MNNYGVYGLFIQKNFPRNLTYGMKMFDAADASIIAVEPGQIGGKEDSGEDIHISGWVLLFAPELLHGTDLEAKMKDYQYFSYFATETLKMNPSEWGRITQLLSQLRHELQENEDSPALRAVILGYIRLVLEYCQRSPLPDGAYPGAAELIGDEDRWRDYITGSIVDATINKDILVNEKIAKPALLRQTFELSSAYSGMELSYNKMIGQLQDTGNTTTLAGYVNLLSQAGLVCALNKYAVDLARKKNSIPKHQVYNNALKIIYCEKPFADAVQDRALWGRLFESAIGAHIMSHATE